MEDSVAVKANREVEAMGEVDDAMVLLMSRPEVRERPGTPRERSGVTAWERLGLPFKLGTGLNLT